MSKSFAKKYVSLSSSSSSSSLFSCCRDDDDEPSHKWHVYATGHSLGGALATLFALELSSSKLAKCGAISLTMYNFGSPRVGNKKFADVYNEVINYFTEDF
ncbi:hypothetical protein Patl1_25753 [Pistacia atlantica]|uniref:Uncharacterized protein n=1 Tax=Pistacia atlantica TaxID=434234 RepID=A0ACC1B0J7_9ROSI|nr:hypothetical protein Patl1_25753 [Pistacia atlantica]